MEKFDPNGVGIANGNIFGFPVSEAEADIILLPIPWDATASYGKGTSRGPEQILAASTQLDFYHPKCEKAFQTKVCMMPVSQDGLALNDQFEAKTSRYIQFLEEGGQLSDHSEYLKLLEEVAAVQAEIKAQLKNKSQEYINKGKIPAVIGGEHSVPLGLLEALNDQGEPFGVLQLDAHADLRDAYEGFEQSHASIYFNGLKLPQLKKLVQVGIRDVAQSEVDLINSSDGRVVTFFDWDIKEAIYRGKSWAEWVAEIIAELPQRVYISYDIDVLEPFLCPHTGTPVSGGFKLEEMTYLIHEVVSSGREIIGFDLCEVANGSTDWDANVGARALWQLVIATERSRRQKLGLD